MVLEEGDPFLAGAIRAAGIAVEGKPEMYRFGELDVARVRRILSRDASPEPVQPAGKPPQLCNGCMYRLVFESIRKQDCIVAGDIGCYTLSVLPPFEAMDTCVCMGASLGVGLGLRHALPPDQARRVVSVIGDSTFVHSGISGLVEMVYNPPPDGHVLIILDNATTAMTGRQEHPGTGRRLNHEPTGRVVVEDLARSLGVRRVHVVEPRAGADDFDRLLRECLAEPRAGGDHRPAPLPAERRSRSRNRNVATDSQRSAMPSKVTNIVVAGLGGQGVLKATDILSAALLRTGNDLKKSEVHGMSQRGGSVLSDVRFGEEVFSPMTPPGEADYLVVLAAEQVEAQRHRLRPGGVLISPDLIDVSRLANKKSLNVALLGCLSSYLSIPEEHWRAALHESLPPQLHQVNEQAFALGRRPRATPASPQSP